jgi:chromosome segregation ATPase
MEGTHRQGLQPASHSSNAVSTDACGTGAQAEIEKGQRRVEALGKELAAAEDSLEAHKAAIERASAGARALSKAKGDVQAQLVKLGQTAKRLDAQRARHEQDVAGTSAQVAEYERVRGRGVRKCACFRSALRCDGTPQGFAAVAARWQQLRVTLRLMRVQKHRWLESDREQLGVEGGPYDFSSMNMREKEKTYSRAVETKERLGQGVNQRVMMMFSKCEEDFNSLSERRRVVLKDREAIQHVRLCRRRLCAAA